MSNVRHVQSARLQQLGNTFITCSCGHRVSGGMGDGVAERNLKHHQYQMSLLAAVRTYAVEHYTENGWDNVVEAYTDAELMAEIRGAADDSIEGAIAHVGAVVGLYHEVQQDRRQDNQLVEGWHY